MSDNEIPPYYCDYLDIDGQRSRLLLHPIKVWFGITNEFTEATWLMSAVDVVTDEEVTLSMSHINV